MRPVVRNFAEAVFSAVPPYGPVYEFGALEISTPTMQGATNFRAIIAGMGLPYVGCDMREGPGVDSIQNLHALDLPDGSVGTVILADTIEHVEYPREAIAEIHRVLADPGMLVITTVMNFLIHAYPEDYWRFTPKGLESLLKPFDTALVSWSGQEVFPRTVAGVAFKGRVPAQAALEANLARWQARENARAEAIAQKEMRDLCAQYFPDKFE